MNSNFCKAEEHAGCSPSGKMTSPSGKSFRCNCGCHDSYNFKKKAAALKAQARRDEAEE